MSIESLAESAGDALPDPRFLGTLARVNPPVRLFLQTLVNWLPQIRTWPRRPLLIGRQFRLCLHPNIDFYGIPIELPES